MSAYVFVLVLILVVCVLLILVVLMQNSKGGGLASNFAGSNQIMGVRKTADVLEKSTWTLAIVLLVLTLFTTFVIPRNSNVDNVSTTSELNKQVEAAGKQPAVDFQKSPQSAPAPEEEQPQS